MLKLKRISILKKQWKGNIVQQITPEQLRVICQQRINIEFSFKRQKAERTLEEAREILRKNLKSIFKEHKFSDFWILDDRDLKGVFYIKAERRGVMKIYPAIDANKVITVEILPSREFAKLPKTLNEMTKRHQRTK